jgi:phage terminase small subunit
VFCCRYVANGNATQAYVEAMPRAATWKRNSASLKAVDLMKRPAVLARIDALQELMVKTSDATFVVHLKDLR